jgi:hypothetical protein
MNGFRKEWILKRKDSLGLCLELSWSQFEVLNREGGTNSRNYKNEETSEESDAGNDKGRCVLRNKDHSTLPLRSETWDGGMLWLSSRGSLVISRHFTGATGDENEKNSRTRSELEVKERPAPRRLGKMQTTKWAKRYTVLPQTTLGQISKAPWTDW